MTVGSTYTPPQYSGDGVTRAFSFPYPYFEASDLGLVLYDSSIPGVVVPAPVLNGGSTYDFAVTGTLDQTGTGEYLYATITCNSAPTSTMTITPVRAVPAVQNTALSNNGPFPAKTIEAGLDRLTILCQQAQAATTRAIVVPASDTETIIVTLPAAAARAGMNFTFDASGNVTASLPATGTVAISSAMQPVVGAASAALADSLLRAPYGAIFFTDYAGCDPTNTTFCDLAWANFVTAVFSSGRPGWVPPGTYKFQTNVVVNFGLASAAAGAAKFYGVLGRSILNITAPTAGPALLLTDLVGAEACFYAVWDGIDVRASCTGPAMQIGQTNHSDAFNGCTFEAVVNNLNTTSAAIGLQVNGCYNCDFNCTTNCAGHGYSFRATEMSFCRIFGSYSGADVGMHFTSFYVFGNFIMAVDLEVVNTCVQIDSANVNDNTWIGGQFVNSNGSGPPVADINATAGGNNRFIGVNFAAGPPVANNTVGIIVYGSYPLGSETFGGLIVSPPGGDGVLSLGSIAGSQAVVQHLLGNALRWSVGRNNAAETGGNAGSDYLISRYSDAGAFLDTPLYITRSTGAVNVLHAALGVGAGGTLSFFGAGLQTQPTVSGSRSGGAALTSLISALGALGLIHDGTSA